MSLDIYLINKEKYSDCQICFVKIDNHDYKYCPWCGTQIDTEVHSQNYTHNVTPMWKKAGVYNALYNSDGKKAKDITNTLRKGIAHMEKHNKAYVKLNPKNNWGSYDTALPWLREFYYACLQNPEAVIGVSK